MIFSEISNRLNLKVERNVDFPHNNNLHFVKISDNDGKSVIMCEESLVCVSNNPQFGIERIITDMKEKFRIGMPVSPLDAIHHEYDEIKSLINVTLIPILNTITYEDAVVKFGDLALTPFVNGDDAKCILTNKHLEKWNVTLEDVLKIAKENQIMDVELKPVIAPMHTLKVGDTWGNSGIIIAAEIIDDICQKNDTSMVFALASQDDTIMLPAQPEMLNDEEFINYTKTILDAIESKSHNVLSHNVYNYNHHTKTFTFCNDTYLLDDLVSMFK